MSRHYPKFDLWSRHRTPYAIYCHHGHGLVYLTEQEYDCQLSAADDLWICPICGREAGWDDNNYEEFYGAVDEKAGNEN